MWTLDAIIRCHLWIHGPSVLCFFSLLSKSYINNPFYLPKSDLPLLSASCLSFLSQSTITQKGIKYSCFIFYFTSFLAHLFFIAPRTILKVISLWFHGHSSCQNAVVFSLPSCLNFLFSLNAVIHSNIISFGCRLYADDFLHCAFPDPELCL